jgi:hypothetical protein
MAGLVAMMHRPVEQGGGGREGGGEREDRKREAEVLKECALDAECALLAADTLAQMVYENAENGAYLLQIPGAMDRAQSL